MTDESMQSNLNYCCYKEKEILGSDENVRSPSDCKYFVSHSCLPNFQLQAYMSVDNFNNNISNKMDERTDTNMRDNIGGNRNKEPFENAATKRQRHHNNINTKSGGLRTHLVALRNVKKGDTVHCSAIVHAGQVRHSKKYIFCYGYLFF